MKSHTVLILVTGMLFAAGCGDEAGQEASGMEETIGEGLASGQQMRESAGDELEVARETASQEWDRAQETAEEYARDAAAYSDNALEEARDEVEGFGQAIDEEANSLKSGD